MFHSTLNALGFGEFFSLQVKVRKSAQSRGGVIPYGERDSIIPSQTDNVRSVVWPKTSDPDSVYSNNTVRSDARANIVIGNSLTFHPNFAPGRSTDI